MSDCLKDAELIMIKALIKRGNGRLLVTGSNGFVGRAVVTTDVPGWGMDCRASACPEPVEGLAMMISFT